MRQWERKGGARRIHAEAVIKWVVTLQGKESAIEEKRCCNENSVSAGTPEGQMCLGAVTAFSEDKWGLIPKLDFSVGVRVFRMMAA